MENATERRKGARLNFSQRLEIIEKYQQEKPSKRSLAIEYNVDEKSIRNIISNSEKIRNSVNNMDTKTRETTYKLMKPKFPGLENSLIKWIETAEICNRELSPKIIIDRAKNMAADLGKSHESFKASRNWYYRFVSRQGLGYLLPVEEVAEREKNVHETSSTLDIFRAIIVKYDPEDIYNMSELGLFYCLLPRYTAFFPEEDLSSIRAKRKLYSRVTLAVCCNSTGMDRLPITMVSKVKAPACIHGGNWPLPIFQQDHALFDKTTFTKWFEEVFRKHIQQKPGRKVLLLLDNIYGYHNDFDIEGIKVVFFPTIESSSNNSAEKEALNRVKKPMDFWNP